MKDYKGNCFCFFSFSRIKKKLFKIFFKVHFFFLLFKIYIVFWQQERLHNSTASYQIVTGGGCHCLNVEILTI